MKKCMMLLTLLFCFMGHVYGIDYKSCNSSDVSRMKALINNVNISYDYYMSGDDAIFSTTVNNITHEIYFVDNRTNKEYHYSDTNSGEITIRGYGSGESGKYKFYSNRAECYGLSLGSKYYKFPYYNTYYNDSICSGLNISLCDKWSYNEYTREELQNLINEYKNKIQSQETEIEHELTLVDKILDFYTSYYVYILLGLIVICSVVIYISRKKNKFNI